MVLVDESVHVQVADWTGREAIELEKKRPTPCQKLIQRNAPAAD